MAYNQTSDQRSTVQQSFYANTGLGPPPPPAAVPSSSSQPLSPDTPRNIPQDPSARPKRKRKAKSRKGLEKVFICQEEGCDKKFTRSEHLARHKLNHSPKQVFHCDWPGCDKSFVREDLRARHIERHMKRQEVETSVKPIIQVQMNVHEQYVKQDMIPLQWDANSTSTANGISSHSSQHQYMQFNNAKPLPQLPAQSPPPPVEPTVRQPSRSPLPLLPGFQQLVSSERWSGTGTPVSITSPTTATTTTATPAAPAPPPLIDSPSSSSNGMEINSLLSSTSIKSNIINRPPLSTSSSYVYPNIYSSTSPRHSTAGTAVTSPHLQSQSPRYSTVNAYSPNPPTPRHSTTSIYTTTSVNRLYNGVSSNNDLSPTSAELIDWYFSDSNMLGSRDFFASNAASLYDLPFVDLSQLSTPPSFFQAKLISESKRNQLLSLIPGLEAFPEFNVENINHYFELYWRNFHVQFPILHKISFEAESTSPHLLLSMMLIGASYDGARDLAAAIAEPFRWIIFSSPGFHPPTKLPILQSLLLLEVYEKTLSTRKFHERAHIHHGATLQLIRRGSTLLNPAYSIGGNVDSTWRKWVEAESTKRAVFMAFILDVLHSVLFGHGLLMGAHEMKLPLPCDDRIWNSTNDDRIKLTSNPPILFLDALKKILNLQGVGVTGFASQALRCGVLSIAIQMSHQAQHISSIGWGSFRDSWKSILVRTFEFEFQDYKAALAIHEREDELMQQQSETDSRSILSGSMNGDDDSTCSRIYDPNGYEYANNHPVVETLYHFLHICIRVARYDLRVFCGDRRILGRESHKNDFETAKKYVYNWVTTAASKEAAFHAIKALYGIFIIGDKASDRNNNNRHLHPADAAGYNVTDDIFIHRSVMIVHCTMVFWVYSFCLEGPESNLMATINEQDNTLQKKDHEWAMAAESGRSFLERMNQAQTPNQLEQLANKNRTVGLLKWVILSLRESKWFALPEMCDILDECVERSLGRVEYIDHSDDDEKGKVPAVGY